MAKKVMGPTVSKRRDGRYAVTVDGKPVNGEEKVKVLLEKGLIKVSAPTKVEEAPAE
jgi:hypothetical protein